MNFAYNTSTIISFTTASIGGVLFIVSHFMKTMVPLRGCEIASNILFGISAYIEPSYPSLAMYCFLTVLNTVRLYQMLQLIKRVRIALNGDLSMDWLKPFMHRRHYGKGEIIFNKGDEATEMFFIVEGRCSIKEFNLPVVPGQIIGELGLLSADRRRTQSVECLEDTEMLTIPYDKVMELYFQNPTFGLYFLSLASKRLFEHTKNALVQSQPNSSV